MTKIVWSDKLSFGIPVIDSQHQHFVELMDLAYDAFYKKETKEELAILLENIKEYTISHFETEEKYFDLFKYENADEHKQAHLLLKEQLLNLMKKFEIDGTKIMPELIDFLEDWLVSHLEFQDKKYVTCFKEHGL